MPTQWLRYNRFLSELPAPLIERLIPRLSVIELSATSIVLAPGEAPKEILFPLNSVVSLQRISVEQQITEICMVGNEGAVGLLDWLYTGEFERQIAILHPGLALRLPVQSMMALVGESFEFQRHLLHYQRKVLSHLAELSFCNQFHSVDQRLARWLRTLFHQVAGRELLLTQEKIAQALGVRRESIAVSLGQLERRGLLEAHRRRLVLLDETALRSTACRCLETIFPLGTGPQPSPQPPRPASSLSHSPQSIGIPKRAS